MAERTEVVLALDWTDYDAAGQSTLVLSGVTSHGRSTPLLWKTVRKSQLKKRRNAIDDALQGKSQLDIASAMSTPEGSKRISMIGAIDGKQAATVATRRSRRPRC